MNPPSSIEREAVPPPSWSWRPQGSGVACRMDRLPTREDAELLRQAFLIRFAAGCREFLCDLTALETLPKDLLYLLISFGNLLREHQAPPLRMLVAEPALARDPTASFVRQYHIDLERRPPSAEIS